MTSSHTSFCALRLFVRFRLVRVKRGLLHPEEVGHKCEYRNHNDNGYPDDGRYT